MTTLSEAYQEAVASVPPDESIVETVEVNHPSFESPVYIAANVGSDQSLKLETGNTVTFVACPLKVTMPEQSEGTVASCKVTIDNVNRDLVPQIRAALGVRAYITVVVRHFLVSDPDEPAFGPNTFTLQNVQMVAASLTGTVVVKNLQNKQFPRKDKFYSYLQFRSLLPG